MLLLSAKQLLLVSFQSILVILLIPALFVCIISRQKEEKIISSPRKITIVYSTVSKTILACIAFTESYVAKGGMETTPNFNAFWKLARNAVIEGNEDLLTVASIALAITNNAKIATLAVILTSNSNEDIVSMQGRALHGPRTLLRRSTC